MSSRRRAFARLLIGAAAVAAAAPAHAEESAPETVATAAQSAADIVVTGRAQKLYRAEEATVGKVPADPLDIPQSVQVITRQLIEDQGARDVTDLYRNVSGISLFSYSGVTFRGFRQDTAFYDGLRGNPFTGFSVPQLFNIERVEFLKGPAGMLYGPGSPGGTINYVTKKPSDIFAADVRGIVGNFDRIGGSAEITGPLTANGAVTARGGLFYEDYDSFRVNAESKTFIGDAGVSFRIAEPAKLTIQATRYDQDLPGNRLRGVQVDPQGNFLTSIRWNHNEPTDFLDLDATVIQARLEGAISDALSYDISGRWFEYNEKQNYHEQQGLRDADGDGVPDFIRREFRDQIRRTEGLSFGANLIARVDLLGANHTFLLGGDWSDEDSALQSRTARPVGTAGGVVPNLSLRDPVYGLTSGADYNLAAVPYARSGSEAVRYGIYLQDQIEIGEHFVLLAGIRNDWFEDTNAVTGLGFKENEITMRFGAIYKPRPDISIYASWSDAFDPQSAGSQDPAAGGPFPPQTGEQIEAGVKTALMDGRIQTGFAAYRIKRQNIVQTDTTRPPINGVNQLAPIGEITSKGVEFDLAADLTPDWVLTFNYGYNDTRVTGTVPGQAITNAVGDRFVNAPKHKLGFWTRYQVAPIKTAFAFGGEYVSARRGFGGEYLPGQPLVPAERVKPYAIFDASIIKDFGFVEAMLRIDNIFDKTYAASGFGLRNGAFPGDPRTVFLEVRKRF